jgi:hypothetical protein
MNTLSLFILLKLCLFHPVHVSYTHIDMDSETGSVNLIFKFFADDLQLLMVHVYETEVTLEPDKPLSEKEVKLMGQYLSNAFSIREKEGPTLILDFVRKEQYEDFVWLHYKGASVINADKGLILINSIMQDLYYDQTNLVILTTGKMEKGFRFDGQVRELTIDLKN